MANEKHVAKLLEGPEEWNKWREENPDVIPDLKGAYLYEARLSRARLEDAHLQGASLGSADLEGAVLVEANLEFALLFDANLKGAFLWKANLRNASLQMAKFQGADLGQADLKFAHLAGANLEGARLRNADLTEADLTGANLEKASVLGLKFKRSTLQTSFRGIRVATCYGSQTFKSFAEDQAYIEELRRSGRKGNLIFWVWWVLADCGRSLLRWAGWSSGLAAAFGVVFWLLGKSNFIEKELDLSFGNMLYYGLVNFFTLGFSAITPSTTTAKVLIVVEHVVGYIMLGGLISIFANKVARRA